MAEGTIDQFIDRGAVKGDADFILEQLNRVYDAYKKLEGSTISLGNVKGSKELSDSIAVLSANLKEYQRISAGVLKDQIATEKLRTATAKATYAEAKASEAVTKAKAAETKEVEKSAAAKAREQKLTEEATNDYLQLSKAYNEAALKAKNYALRLGEQHPITEQAVKDANDLGNVLKRLDAAVGQNQRNAGNYKSAFDGLGMSFTQVARELPSLTISVQQFALAISNNLPMVADELKKAKNEIAALKAEGKDTPSLFQRIAKGLFSWQVALSLVITAGTFLLNMMRSTKKETEGAANAQEEYNKRLADARKEVAAEVADVKVLVQQIKSENLTKAERIATIKELKRIAPEYFNLLNEEKATVVDVTKAYDTFIGSINRSVEARVLNKQLDEIVDKRLKLEKDLGIGARTVETAVVNGRVVVTAINAIYSDQGELNARQAEYNDLKKEEGEIVKRLALLQPKQTAEQKTERGDAVKKAKEEADKRKEIEAAIQIERLQRDADTFKQIADSEDKSLEDRLIALREYYAAKLQIVNIGADLEKKIGNKTARELVLIDEKRLTETKDLESEALKARNEIINKFSAEFSKGQKEAYDAADKVIQAAYNRWAKLEEERTKKNKEEGKKREKDDAEFAANKKKLQQELAAELTTLAFTIGTASIEREKNATQEQIDQLEVKKQKDIEVANQTIANAQDRAAAIQIIEARAAAQKEQLERRQRELDVKKAQFDKAQSIAKIIQETAINVIKYFGTPLALLAGAIGAVQLATVIAQPIPRYKHGKRKGDNYEGPAVVGDGGKSELIERADGTLEVTPDRPTLTFVKKRDIVHPDARTAIAAAALQETGKALLMPGKAISDNGTKRLEAKLDTVVDAIKGQPKTQISANEGGLTAVIKYGASQLKYINDNVNW